MAPTPRRPAESSSGIAVIGLGCRLPGAKDPREFWRLLEGARDAVTEIPSERWSSDEFYHPEPGRAGKMNTRWGGFLDHVDRFDAEFFGLAAAEAERMDPQQRLVLEVAWEALESAGIVPADLSGTGTSVYLGVSHADHNRILYFDYSTIDAYNGTNTYLCIAANRLSHLLNLHGPSLGIDTACSSSLVAVHTACRALRSGETDLVLAGGVNLNLAPDEFISLSHAGLMASDGRCKVFDARADGYCRAEGCGIVVLKRLDDAQADGDTIHAVLRGSAVNHDGLSNGLTAPNGVAQKALLRAALADAGVEPADIDLVECQAVGTTLGDQIELKSLQAVLGEGRAEDRICWVGSVKTNIGYLEPAAGIAGLLKVILALQHDLVPAHLHLRELNPLISLEDTPFEIPTTGRPWPRRETPRLAGVSSFGFGGTNCHVIVQEAPSPSAAPASSQSLDAPPCHLLTVSAQSSGSLHRLTERHLNRLRTLPEAELGDYCHTANTRRSVFPWRLAVCGATAEELHRRLDEWLATGTAPGVSTGRKRGRRQPKVGFLFSGESADAREAARRLSRLHETFRQAADAGLPARPALVALEIHLVQFLEAVGVRPHAVCGDGLGHLAAQVAVGRCDPATALRVASEGADTFEGAAEGEAHVPWFQGWGPDTAAALREHGCDHLLAIGPGQSLTAWCRDPLPEGPSCCATLPTPGHEWRSLLLALGDLFCRGTDVDWAMCDQGRPRRVVDLPHYPFERTHYSRYWTEMATFSAHGHRGSASRFPSQSFHEVRRALRAAVPGDPELPGLAQAYVLERVALTLGTDVARLDEEKSLADCGFDSLMLPRALVAIQEDTGVMVSASEAIAAPDLKSLAAVLLAALEAPTVPP